MDSLGSLTVLERAEGDEEEDAEERELKEFGTIRVVDFADYEQLHKEDNGLYSTAQAPVQAEEGEAGPRILWKSGYDGGDDGHDVVPEGAPERGPDVKDV